MRTFISLLRGINVSGCARGYLRDAGLVSAPAWILIRLGEAMGRPSRLNVEIPANGGIVVTGAAVPIELG